MTKRIGWLLTPAGQRHQLPDHLLEEEVLSWPLSLPEMSPGAAVQYLDSSSMYRRHELVPGEAYVFLRENLKPHNIPESVIAELLGPELVSKQPRRWNVQPRSLRLIADGIGDRSLELRPNCRLIFPTAMWQDATDSERTVFTNLAKIHGVNFRVENTGVGPAYWSRD